MTARARKHNESFSQYRKNLRNEEYYLKRRLKGSAILYNPYSTGRPAQAFDDENGNRYYLPFRSVQ